MEFFDNGEKSDQLDVETIEKKINELAINNEININQNKINKEKSINFLVATD